VYQVRIGQADRQTQVAVRVRSVIWDSEAGLVLPLLVRISHSKALLRRLEKRISASQTLDYAREGRAFLVLAHCGLIYLLRHEDMVAGHKGRLDDWPSVDFAVRLDRMKLARAVSPGP
jgi:hypothetical protein